MNLIFLLWLLDREKYKFSLAGELSQSIWGYLILLVFAGPVLLIAGIILAIKTIMPAASAEVRLVYAGIGYVICGLLVILLDQNLLGIFTVSRTEFAFLLLFWPPVLIVRAITYIF